MPSLRKRGDPSPTSHTLPPRRRGGSAWTGRRPAHHRCHDSRARRCGGV